MSKSQITLTDFYALHRDLKSNEIILDVRNPDEFNQGHIANALNIPVTEVANHVEKLKNYDTIYIHCKRGGRAKTAFELLSASGLQNLVCVYDAGMDLWMEKGYPVKK